MTEHMKDATEGAGGPSALSAGLERHFDAMQQLLDEAADVIDRLPIDVRDALEVRHCLATELYGTAAMVRVTMRSSSNA